jgi:BTB/POZ domain
MWNVHKCILAVRCPAVKMAMKPVRHEDGIRLIFPPHVSMINMDDDDPDAVDSMLHYLYTQKIDYSQRFVDKSIEKDIRHFVLAMGLGHKYDLPMFTRMARTELEARIKASDGTALPHIVRAMHLKSASDPLVAMRDFVVGEAAALFCKGGPFNDVMEAMAIEFPKFGFDVMSHTTKELMAKIVKFEEGGGEGDAEDEEDGDDEPIKQLKPRRNARRTTAAQKRG